MGFYARVPSKGLCRVEVVIYEVLRSCLEGQKVWAV